MVALRKQILKRLSQPDAVEFVCQLIDSNPDINRTDLAERLCDQFGFVNLLGGRQASGCLKALRKLEARGLFILPPPLTKPGCPTPRRLGYSVPSPEELPTEAGEILGLELVEVKTEEQMRVWNELFDQEHPRGAGPLVGRQLRYLIGSEHGWLGGLGFAASAWRLNDRDRWIGWDEETRQMYLDQVVGLSRFLIRPCVRCRNLASRILGLAMQRLPHDFAARYGYQPWLVETFVDTSCFEGTCYRAANWIRVGSTVGTGRYDSPHYGEETVKDIYVYPLVKDFRRRMGLSVHSGLGPLPLDAGLEGEQWAEHEFGDAPLGDRRLSRRLVQSVAVQAENPGRAFCGAAQGDNAIVKGYYRFIDQPDESAVTMENILLPHRAQTLRRMEAQKTVLCIQDGTDLNYNGLAQCEGLGVIGNNQTGAKSCGLHLHSTLAVTDDGLPLGVIRAQCSAPESRSEDDTRTTAEIPIAEKKNYAWIEGMKDCAAIAAQMPHTRIVCVMDREADFFELFDAWHQDQQVDLLIRANHNRCTTEDLKLFDAVRATEPRLQFTLFVNRQSARPKKSGQKARSKRPERVAEMTSRYRHIELKPSFYHQDKSPIGLWIIHATEDNPPKGVKPVEWFLLTTMEISTPEQAKVLLDWYCLRWRIEDWHRVLKSGCGIEELQHETVERLKRAIAINVVIAWRIMLLTLLGRETPELPPEVYFDDIELAVLEAYAKSRRLPPPTTLGAAVLLVSKIGGYMGRKSDPPPGNEIMWYGYTGLRLMSMGYSLRGP